MAKKTDIKAGKHANSILESLREYEKTPDSAGMELRLSLAELLLQHLRCKGWAQRDLASAAGMKESFVSRILHSDANCTLDTAGKLLFALGIKARFSETVENQAETGDQFIIRMVHTYDESKSTQEDFAGRQIEADYSSTEDSRSFIAPPANRRATAGLG